MAKLRLQKVLAAAGWGSRRACEDLIREGRVTVNGRVRAALPVLVDPKEDSLRVDNRPVKRQRTVYYLLNKPKGVLCTNKDPANRVRAVDLLGGVKERVFPVGRLDAGSTGLLLITNDGDLAEKLTHPRFGIERTYLAQVSGRIVLKTVEKLQKGLWMSDGRTQPARVRVIRRGQRDSRVEITLREGKNREVRRMFAALGHRVLTLKRIRFGPLTVRGLPIGAHRSLAPPEVARLKKLAEQVEARARENPRGKKQKTTRPVRKRSTRTQKPGPAPRKSPMKGPKKGRARRSKPRAKGRNR